jgi:hypothetical protein
LIGFLHSVNAKVLVLLAVFVCFSIQKLGFLGACESFCWWQRFGMVFQSPAFFFLAAEDFDIHTEEHTFGGSFCLCPSFEPTRKSGVCVCSGALLFCCYKNVACGRNLMTVNGYVQVSAKWSRDGVLAVLGGCCLHDRLRNGSIRGTSFSSTCGLEAVDLIHQHLTIEFNAGGDSEQQPPSPAFQRQPYILCSFSDCLQIPHAKWCLSFCCVFGKP